MKDTWRDDAGITVTERPPAISFEDIYQAIWEPLEDRQKDRETFVSEWRQSLAKTGECFIALSGGGDCRDALRDFSGAGQLVCKGKGSLLFIY